MEECYSPAKLKRKDLEQVHDDFSLSSPATKIRRLNVELPPIIEEKEMVNPVVESFEAIDDLIVNEERAIVLYDPMNNSRLFQLQSPFSLSVNSDFLSGYKNPMLWSNQSNALESLKEKQDEQNKNNGNLAVVPWVPMHSQHQSMPEVEIPHTEEVYEMMEIEEDDDNSQRVDCVNEFGTMKQCQQHCMIPDNLSAPIAF